MPTVQLTDLADLVSTSLNHLGGPKYSDLMSTIQDHPAAKRLLKKEKVAQQGGPEVEFNALTGTNANFRWVGTHDDDQIAIPDLATKGKIGWRHNVAGYGFDEREPEFNSGAARIVDLVKERRTAAFGDWVENMETAFWSKPPDSSNTTKPHGVAYWIVYNSSDGFTGGSANSETTVGNINLSTLGERWKNYSATYAAMTKADAIEKMKDAMMLCDFKPLVENQPLYNTGDRFLLACNRTTYKAFENLAEAQNDNLGNDLWSRDGNVTFRRTPMLWAPKLDSYSAGNPIYGLNWGTFQCFYRKGRWLKETQKNDPKKHNVVLVFLDTSCNFICRDRRRNFILATAALSPATLT